MPGRQERRLELGRPVLLVLVLAPLGLEQGPLLVLEHCTMIHRCFRPMELERRLEQPRELGRELERPQVLVLQLVPGRQALRVRLHTYCRASCDSRTPGRPGRPPERVLLVPLVLVPARRGLGPLLERVLERPQELEPGREQERLRELGPELERPQVLVLQLVPGRQEQQVRLRICYHVSCDSRKPGRQGRPPGRVLLVRLVLEPAQLVRKRLQEPERVLGRLLVRVPTVRGRELERPQVLVLQLVPGRQVLPVHRHTFCLV
jgi:hypothetical protein